MVTTTTSGFQGLGFSDPFTLFNDPFTLFSDPFTLFSDPLEPFSFYFVEKDQRFARHPTAMAR
eukprot:11603617-Heterocapsa_arctica.AAC.1